MESKVITPVALLSIAFKLGKSIAAKLRRINHAPAFKYLQRAAREQSAHDEENIAAFHLVVAQFGAHCRCRVICLLGVLHLAEHDAAQQKTTKEGAQ